MNSRSEDALIALRQIQRKTEQASKRLASTAHLTPSQLLVMQILSERGETSAGEISKLTQLKHATITSLVDKLVARGLMARRRSESDRRRVWLTLLPEGEKEITSAPDLLQDTFQSRFETLPDWHQSMLVSALERVAALLDAEDLEAAPILDIGALDERPEV
ncbi:MAG: MarR family transcriptional regulator [Pseudomonadota bacterium]